MLNKTCEELIRDLAKYALKGVKDADPCRGECETELADSIRETVRDFIAALGETEEDLDD